jgi:hypothetical protein
MFTSATGPIARQFIPAPSLKMSVQVPDVIDHFIITNVQPFRGRCGWRLSAWVVVVTA